MPQHVLSASEKCQLDRLHRVLKAEVAQGIRPPGRTLRQRIKEITGYATSTISVVLAKWNKHHDPLFATTFGSRGHRRRSIAENYGSEIRNIITSRNLNQLPTNTAHVVSALQNAAGFVVSLRTMRDVVKRLGFSYVAGQKRNIAADAAGTVKFREEYLLKKTANRDHHRHPLRPEVFLDESYVNEHQVAARSWLPADRIRYAKSGKGRRFCIVGAGVLHRENGSVRGEWVEGSLKYWQSDLAPSEQEDYHGNFDSNTFEDWFRKLCGTLKETYGECNIVMDGASYHKRIVKSVPRKSWKKERIFRWLVENEIPWGTDTKKKTLLQLAAATKTKVTYAATTIAVEYGHKLFYTPPYHPELQPIEVIWGVLKNRIAVEPATSMADLKKKLGVSLSKVSSRTWVGAYNKVLKKEDEYMVKVLEDQERRRAIIDAETHSVGAVAADHEHEEYTFQC